MNQWVDSQEDQTGKWHTDGAGKPPNFRIMDAAKTATGPEEGECPMPSFQDGANRESTAIDLE